MQQKSIQMDHITLGVCYYPEHWPEALWQDDLRRMLSHGIEVIRVFEFAWNIVQPQEDMFSFDLFDRFLALAEREGMRVILCTPTATPPAWLTHKYPEVLNADIDGHLMHHGHRRHYNYNSQRYLSFTEQIVQVLAERYGQHPAIIGWQIDNEINCEINEFYAEADRDAFRAWLRERFGSLETLNEAIGANFWSQTYTDWAQVDLPRRTPAAHGNPHLELLAKRFTSRSAINYVKLQSDILRLHVGDRFVTTNGLFGHLDNFEMTQTALDFMTYDSYPNFAYGESGINAASGSLLDRNSAMNLGYARALSPSFGVMEQQAGANGWDFRMLSPMPRPGQMRLWTMQSIAHGADFVSYFRWRTCSYGTEMYWHGLNDYSNRTNRRLEELKHIRSGLARLKGLTGSRYQAQVALVSDYLNEWDGERDRWHGEVRRLSKSNIFAAAQRSHTPIDFVWIRNTRTHDTALAELARYRMLFYPHAAILSEKTAALLTAYVQQGGILVMGARTGYKDEFGRCPMMPMPGFARALCGAEVEDYTLARPEDMADIRLWGQTVQAPVFHDILRPVDGGECVGRFMGCYYDGQAAVVRKQYEGGGSAYYVGSGFSQQMALALLKTHGLTAPFGALIACGEEVEIACREKDGRQFVFVLNYTKDAQTIQLKQPVKELLSCEIWNGERTLGAFDVRVFAGTQECAE